MKEKKDATCVKEDIDAFADKPITIPESIDMENHLIATYWAQMDKAWDAAVMSQVIAIEQTTGT